PVVGGLDVEAFAFRESVPQLVGALDRGDDTAVVGAHVPVRRCESAECGGEGAVEGYGLLEERGDASVVAAGPGQGEGLGVTPERGERRGGDAGERLGPAERSQRLADSLTHAFGEAIDGIDQPGRVPRRLTERDEGGAVLGRDDARADDVS